MLNVGTHLIFTYYYMLKYLLKTFLTRPSTDHRISYLWGERNFIIHIQAYYYMYTSFIIHQRQNINCDKMT